MGIFYLSTKFELDQQRGALTTEIYYTHTQIETDTLPQYWIGLSKNIIY